MTPGRHVIVTGAAGYIGSLLGPELMGRGYDVIGLDTGFYRDRQLYGGGKSAPMTMAKDIRRIEAKDLRGIDAAGARERVPAACVRGEATGRRVRATSRAGSPTSWPKAR